MFNYGKIFKQAWVITKTHKFLWPFGLFLVLGSVLNFFGNSPEHRIETVVAENWRGYAMTAGLVLAILMIILYYRSWVGLIIAIKAILDKQETSFKKAFNVSRVFYGRVFGVSILIILALCLVAMVLGQPLQYLVSRQMQTQAWVLGILAVVIFIPALITGLLAGVLGPLFVVIFDMKIRESLDKSFGLIKQFLPQLIIFGLALFIIEALPFVLLQVLDYYTDGLAVWIVGSILICLIQIILIVFQNAAWVLFFLELVRPQKLEQEEPIPAPEIAGG